MAETVLLIIITLINIVLWLVFFFRLRKMFSSEYLLHDIKNEVDKLLIEINRTADQDITLLEARVKGLKNLIAEADKRIMLLQGQSNERRREKTILEKLSPVQQEKPQEQRAAAVYKKMQAGIEDTEAVQLSIDFDSYRIPPNEDMPRQGAVIPDEPEIIHSEDRSITELPLKTRVLKLDAEGFSADMIAKKLEMSITEVQLIIDLFSI